MIEEDFKHMLEHQNSSLKSDAAGEKSGEGKPGAVGPLKSGQAIWNYAVQTLDPVANETLMGEDNHYYLVCLLGKFCDTSSSARLPRNPY
jgi:betaine lipid synthase